MAQRNFTLFTYLATPDYFFTFKTKIKIQKAKIQYSRNLSRCDSYIQLKAEDYYRLKATTK